MLREGRIPLNEHEGAAIDKLVEQHGDLSFTRRDPGETGPLLVHIGDDIYEVDENGDMTAAD